MHLEQVANRTVPTALASPCPSPPSDPYFCSSPLPPRLSSAPPPYLASDLSLTEFHPCLAGQEHMCKVANLPLAGRTLECFDLRPPSYESTGHRPQSSSHFGRHPPSPPSSSSHQFPLLLHLLPPSDGLLRAPPSSGFALASQTPPAASPSATPSLA